MTRHKTVPARSRYHSFLASQRMLMNTQLSALILRAILAASLASFLFGCASNFTSEKIDALHQGMTGAEVQKLFGPPNQVHNTACGREEKWACEIWTYRGSHSSTFWFSTSGGERLLNSWSVERD